MTSPMGDTMQGVCHRPLPFDPSFGQDVKDVVRAFAEGKRQEQRVARAFGDVWQAVKGRFTPEAAATMADVGSHLPFKMRGVLKRAFSQNAIMAGCMCIRALSADNPTAMLMKFLSLWRQGQLKAVWPNSVMRYVQNHRLV